MRKIYSLLLFLALTLVEFTAQAQGFTTLFPYPQAPDTCTTLESPCNYSTQHFWDHCEMGKPFVDSKDSLLLKAMNDYLSIMRQANVNVSLASIRNLMFKAQANQPNFVKLMQFAEFLLYMNPAPVIDDVYLAFAQSAVDASWLKKDMKEHYRQQIDGINASKLGHVITSFPVQTATGSRQISEIPLDTAEIVLFFFTDDDSNSDIARTRLSADLGVNDLVSQGYTKVVNIYTGKNPKQFFETARQYPGWVLVSAPEIYKKIDVRLLPSFYVLDRSLKIMNKNITVDDVKNAFNGN